MSKRQRVINMRKQGGWAGLLAMGLAAILGTGGVVAVMEEATDASGPTLVSTLFGNPQVRQDTAIARESSTLAFIPTSLSLPVENTEPAP